jgi:hypothetical protein
VTPFTLEKFFSVVALNSLPADAEIAYQRGQA